MCLYVGFNLGLTRGRFGVLAMAIIAWNIIRFALTKMGKTDPFMLNVFTRSTQYSDKPFHTQFFIPAHGTIDTKTPATVYKRWLAK
jgi:hypothetical protein